MIMIFALFFCVLNLGKNCVGRAVQGFTSSVSILSWVKVFLQLEVSLYTSLNCFWACFGSFQCWQYVM